VPVPADERATYQLQIAGQPLDAALREFARQSGIQLVFFSRLTEGYQAPALQGEYTLRGALTVQNVFDKRYYTTLSIPTASNWVGAPRSVLMRVDADVE
jgi:hypothetical protein